MIPSLSPTTNLFLIGMTKLESTITTATPGFRRVIGLPSRPMLQTRSVSCFCCRPASVTIARLRVVWPGFSPRFRVLTRRWDRQFNFSIKRAASGPRRQLLSQRRLLEPRSLKGFR